MSYRAWVCETCDHAHRSEHGLWGNCPGCQKEVCDWCGDTYMHCKPCSQGKTDEELRLAANATNEVYFDPPEQERFFSPSRIVDRIMNEWEPPKAPEESR